MPLKLKKRGEIWHYTGTVAGRRLGNIDGEGDEDFPDENPAVIITFGRSKVYTVTLGDFRRARAALSEKTV